MTSVKILTVAAAFMAFAAASAFAGPTGQINIPSTDAKGLKEVAIGVNNYARFSSDASAGANSFALSLTTGLLPFDKVKAEIGVDYTTTGPGSVYPITYNAKLATAEDALFKGMPAFAVGGYNFSFNRNNPGGSSNVVYGLTAKTLPVIGRLSAGGYTGHKSALNGINNRSGVLASWDRTMSEVSDKLWLAVDYMSGSNGLGGIAVGGSWAFSKQVSLLTGVTFYNKEALGGKTSFTTQLVISLP